MLLMMAEVLRSWEVARELPASVGWQWLKSAQTHVEWSGCSLHDLIQPSFSFLVGVALPFSIASRVARNQATSKIMLHAVWRALVLILLGIFLRSVGQLQTNWTFEDTLTQIGLGYPFLVLIGFRAVRMQWWTIVLILAGYWLAWALYPISNVTPLPPAAGVPPDWPHHATGFAAHWAKNANLGAAFDQWFLNLFPRSEPFVANSGGYLTLNFIPTLGTMLLGLIAGGWLRSSLPNRLKIQRMLTAGLAGILLGLALDRLGVCPLVKRIWTPSWTLFSGGWCFLILTGFYATIDVLQSKAWSFPLLVIGMNSIAAYCIAHLFEPFIADTLITHFGAHAFSHFGEAMVPFYRGIIVLTVYWLILFWMYRRKLFLKI